jgi:hypothetical protein
MGKIKRLLMIIIALVFFGGAIYLAWQWKVSQGNHSSSKTPPPTDWEDIDPADNTFVPSTEVLNGNLENIEDPADWRIYQNGRLGFSLNVPQRVLGVDNCKQTKFEAKILVYDDYGTGGIFIVPEYYFDNYTPTTTTVEDPDRITFEEDDPINTGDPNLSDNDNDGVFDCRKKFYTLPLIKKEIVGDRFNISSIPIVGNPAEGISLHITKIVDTDMLNEFIRNVYGAGGAIVSKEEWSGQENTYRLTIKKTGDKDYLGRELACATDQVTDILYNPSKNKLVYAYLPKGGMLFSDGGEVYDQDMFESIRFY